MAKEYFDIEAESVSIVVNDNVSTLILFRPTEETLARIRACSQAQCIGPIRVIDKWDDGTNDIFISDVGHNFIGFTGSGQAGKTHTFKLTLVSERFFEQFNR